MRRVEPRNDWPDSWKESFQYDLQEVYGEHLSLGYFYAYQRRRRSTLGLVEKYVPPGARVLDVAAAQGNYSLALQEKIVTNMASVLVRRS